MKKLLTSTIIAGSLMTGMAHASGGLGPDTSAKYTHMTGTGSATFYEVSGSGRTLMCVNRLGSDSTGAQFTNARVSRTTSSAHASSTTATTFTGVNCADLTLGQLSGSPFNEIVYNTEADAAKIRMIISEFNSYLMGEEAASSARTEANWDDFAESGDLGSDADYAAARRHVTFVGAAPVDPADTLHTYNVAWSGVGTQLTTSPAGASTLIAGNGNNVADNFYNYVGSGAGPWTTSEAAFNHFKANAPDIADTVNWGDWTEVANSRRGGDLVEVPVTVEFTTRNALTVQRERRGIIQVNGRADPTAPKTYELETGRHELEPAMQNVRNPNYNPADELTDWTDWNEVRRTGGQLDHIVRGAVVEGTETLTNQGDVQGGEVSDNSASKPKWLITKTTATYRIDTYTRSQSYRMDTKVFTPTIIHEARTRREIRINGDNDRSVLRETRTRTVDTPTEQFRVNIGEITTRTVRVELTPASTVKTINPAWLAARDAFKQKTKKDLQGGGYLKATAVTDEGIEVEYGIDPLNGHGYVAPKITGSTETASHKLSGFVQPRAGLLVGSRTGLTHGLKVEGAAESKASGTKVFAGYDTGTHFKAKGKHDGFTGLKVEGRTDSSTYAGIQGKNGYYAKLDTDGVTTIGIKDGDVDVSANTEGQLQFNLKFKF